MGTVLTLIYFYWFSSFQSFHSLLELLYLSPSLAAPPFLVKTKSSVICMNVTHDWRVNVGHSITSCPT
jgi:hypothetical protein